MQGALTGGLFGAAGAVGGANDPSRYLAHAGAGCVSAVAGGGKCGQGAASAVFGKFATNNINIQNDIGRGIATVVAGGVGSVIGGGKFANGAETAAYGYLCNEMLTRKDGSGYKSSGRSYHGDRTMSEGMMSGPNETLFNADASAGFTAALGRGVSYSGGVASDITAGQCQVTFCFIAGPIAGVAAHGGGSIDVDGVPSNNELSVTTIGAWVPGVGAKYGVSATSSGANVSVSPSVDQRYGKGVGICTALTGCR